MDDQIVRLIFKDTYNFYLKHKCAKTDSDWVQLVEEEHQLSKKYPYKLCRLILVELMTLIQD